MGGRDSCMMAAMFTTLGCRDHGNLAFTSTADATRDTVDLRFEWSVVN